MTGTVPLDHEFLDEVHAGLSRSSKMLPCRYFYDQEGSRLFERICELPEYYLTRTEDAILRERADEIAAALPGAVELVELGSGSARKTRRLLEALLRRQGRLRYVPVDISAGMLTQTAQALSREYPRLEVAPIVAEYGEGMRRLREERQGSRLILFLGSNLGNFEPGEAEAFLRQIRSMMVAGDHALLGLDLQKPASVLEAAYADAAGVTSAFNLNLLRRINHELGGDFDLAAFEHLARYNMEEGRVEMYLASTRPQVVTVAGRQYSFRQGELIHTENSYKYSPKQIASLVGAAGLKLVRAWADPKGWFSVNLFAPV